MAKYRKKVIVEAFQYDGDLKGSDGNYYVPEWAVKAYKAGILYYHEIYRNNPPELLIRTTMEDSKIVSVGDYIICGVTGELYPCKKEIFEKTYEQVNYVKEEAYEDSKSN